MLRYDLDASVPILSVRNRQRRTTVSRMDANHNISNDPVDRKRTSVQQMVRWTLIEDSRGQRVQIANPHEEQQVHSSRSWLTNAEFDCIPFVPVHIQDETITIVVIYPTPTRYQSHPILSKVSTHRPKLPIIPPKKKTRVQPQNCHSFQRSNNKTRKTKKRKIIPNQSINHHLAAFIANPSSAPKSPRFHLLTSPPQRSQSLLSRILLFSAEEGGL